jgi:Domain of unknown function (DUF4351)/Putative restriction endonuclease
MLDENWLDQDLSSEALRLPFPTEEDLPETDGKPVDNELQVLAPGLLRSILAFIWAERFDWFFGVNLGIYPLPYEPAICPDGFLSLGVDRVRDSEKLRLSYVVYHEKVMPQWVLEVVSRTPGGEYDSKFERYAEMGVLYYAIYNPSYTRRDKHEIFELYRLENGQYVRQQGNPIWMPEIGLGIGRERATQEGVHRDWLYWYNEAGDRYLPLENALEQERILREREQLIRRELEEQLTQTAQTLVEAESNLIEAESNLEQERQRSLSRQRSLLLRQLHRKLTTIPNNLLTQIDRLSVAQLEALSEALFDFGAIDDLTVWLYNQK